MPADGGRTMTGVGRQSERSIDAAGRKVDRARTIIGDAQTDIAGCGRGRVAHIDADGRWKARTRRPAGGVGEAVGAVIAL